MKKHRQPQLGRRFVQFHRFAVGGVKFAAGTINNEALEAEIARGRLDTVEIHAIAQRIERCKPHKLRMLCGMLAEFAACLEPVIPAYGQDNTGIDLPRGFAMLGRVNFAGGAINVRMAVNYHAQIHF